MLTRNDNALSRLDEEIRRSRKSPDEVAALLSGARSFDYDRWTEQHPPATAEELADAEELMREWRAERESSLRVITERDR
jgi:hypothetical protein